MKTSRAHLSKKLQKTSQSKGKKLLEDEQTTDLIPEQAIKASLQPSNPSLPATPIQRKQKEDNPLNFPQGEFQLHNGNDSHTSGEQLSSVLQKRALESSTKGPVQLKINSIRFRANPTLQDILAGKRVLKEGDQDIAVIILAQALAELGYYNIDVFNKTYTYYEELKLSEYQRDRGINPSGTLDKATLEQLDKDFSQGYKVERDRIASINKSDLLKGTHTPGPEASKAIKETISTEVKADPRTGKKPVFKNKIAGKGKYENRIRTAVESTILSQYNRLGKGKQLAHSNKKNLHDEKHVEKVALESKKAVDAIFGDKYYQSASKPALVMNVNLFDAWKYKTKLFSSKGAAYTERSINWRVQKIIQSNSNRVAAINKEHGADQSANPAKGILAGIKAEMVKKYRNELIETHKGWPGFANNGKVYLQLFKGKTDNANKKILWGLFQTCIHEYIHTLEHQDHVKYRNGMGDKQGGKVLREGITDYLTKIVWNGVSFNDTLRQSVEGSYYNAKSPFKVKSKGAYGEAKNAEQLAGIVGLKNLLAAFFLGKIDLIQ